MTGTELESVVDKLADKLGVAVNQLEPIAQEVLDQYIARATVFTIVWAVFLVVFSIAINYSIKRIFKEKKKDYKEKDDDIIVAFFCVSSICSIMILVSTIQVFCYASQVFAPLASILGL